MHNLLSWRGLFLILAIWGAIHPMYYFLRFMRVEGGGLGGLIDAWYVNDSTTGLTWDLTIAAIALTVWVVRDTLQTRRWSCLLAIPATFCIGVSCGLPLFAFLRLGGR
ncbi:DUF2834 domain-containing protein [Meridianimarinicoccus sp. MJW13]|uniref:DUF2834 domain-containing protein n=1 Tax=Meridianimarinicoccus sp. MJW13 TaxID=2720031 RepID=UPI003743CF45